MTIKFVMVFFSCLLYLRDDLLLLLLQDYQVALKLDSSCSSLWFLPLLRLFPSLLTRRHRVVRLGYLQRISYLTSHLIIYFKFHLINNVVYGIK